MSRKTLLKQYSSKAVSTFRNRGLTGLVRSLANKFRKQNRERSYLFLAQMLFKPNSQARCLNLGGGSWYYPRWENIDLYADPIYVDHKMDFRKKMPIPLPARCTRVIFTSHLLEHISDDACQFLLKECYRILQSNGIIRISVPDMEKAFKAYHENDIDFFNRGGVTVVGKTIERKLVNFFASYGQDGYSGGPIIPPEVIRYKLKTLPKYEFISWCVSNIPKNATYKAHVNGYDFYKMKKILKQAGFSRIVRSSYRKSSIPAMRGPAFDNRPAVSLYVEAIK
jgi:hypothetical protein